MRDLQPTIAGTTATTGTIASSIRRMIDQDPTLREANLADTIRIEERHGLVTVAGKVPSRAIENRLIKSIERLPGVEAVVNDVELDALSPCKTPSAGSEGVKAFDR